MRFTMNSGWRSNDDLRLFVGRQGNRAVAMNQHIFDRNARLVMSWQQALELPIVAALPAEIISVAGRNRFFDVNVSHPTKKEPGSDAACGNSLDGHKK